MMRWKVRKSRRTGDWWAHKSGCLELGGLWCALFGGCMNCRTFERAYLYAEAMGRMGGYAPNVFGQDWLERNRKEVADDMARGPIFKRSHNSL